MVRQKFDLVDSDIASAGTILQYGPESEKTRTTEHGPDKAPIAIAFDHGDVDNSGNWPKVDFILHRPLVPA